MSWQVPDLQTQRMRAYFDSIEGTEREQFINEAHRLVREENMPFEQALIQAYGAPREPWPVKTAAQPFEAHMWHGSKRGLLGPIRPRFFATSFENEAKGFTGEDRNTAHPVTIRFRRPAHYFGHMDPDAVERAQAEGNDGIVVHFPEDMRDPSDPYPQRQWAIAMDPGAVIPGHAPKGLDELY